MRVRFTSATNVTTLPLMRPGKSITKSTDTKVSHLIVTNVISREHLRGLFQGTQQAYTSIENSIAQYVTIKAQSLSASTAALRRPTNLFPPEFRLITQVSTHSQRRTQNNESETRNKK